MEYDFGIRTPSVRTRKDFLELLGRCVERRVITLEGSLMLRLECNL